MDRTLHIFLFVMIFVNAGSAQLNKTVWELNLNTTYHSYFQEAYQLYPKIPKGVLESVAYTATHIRHIQPKQEAPSCVGSVCPHIMV